MKVAFDCDGTLKGYDDKLRPDMCRLLIAFIWSGAEVIVWSGGGKGYAESVFNQALVKFTPDRETYLALYDKVTCMAKNMAVQPDLTFDDEYVSLGKTNVCIKPVSEFDQT